MYEVRRIFERPIVLIKTIIRAVLCKTARIFTRNIEDQSSVTLEQSCPPYQTTRVLELSLFIDKIFIQQRCLSDLKVSFATVTRTIKKLKLTGSTKKGKSTGRPRKLNAEARAFIEDQMWKDDETTSWTIQKKLARQSRGPSINSAEISKAAGLDSSMNEILLAD